MEKEFSASMDLTAKLVTWGCLLLILPAVFIVMQDDEALEAVWVVGGIVALVFTLAYAWSPRKYIVTDAGLVVKRPFGEVKIAASRIESIEEVEARRIRFSLRTFGSGGFFGYFGSFYNFAFGRMTWYMTNMRHPLLIRTKGGEKIFVSPDDVKGFIAALKRN